MQHQCAERDWYVLHLVPQKKYTPYIVNEKHVYEARGVKILAMKQTKHMEMHDTGEATNNSSSSKYSARKTQAGTQLRTQRRGRCAAKRRHVKHAASEILVIKQTQQTEMMMYDTGATAASASAASTQRAKRKQGHNCTLTAGASLQRKSDGVTLDEPEAENSVLVAGQNHSSTATQTRGAAPEYMQLAASFVDLSHVVKMLVTAVALLCGGQLDLLVRLVVPVTRSPVGE